MNGEALPRVVKGREISIPRMRTPKNNLQRLENNKAPRRRMKAQIFVWESNPPKIERTKRLDLFCSLFKKTKRITKERANGGFKNIDTD